MSETTRAWIYRVCVAAVPLLVTYGVVGEGEAALWVGLAGAALGLSSSLLAAGYTSTSKTTTE
jgi:NCAIR mutase (PurE)-related protein